MVTQITLHPSSVLVKRPGADARRRPSPSAAQCPHVSELQLEGSLGYLPSIDGLESSYPRTLVDRLAGCDTAQPSK
jgi:hypothetical protein